MRKIKYVLTFSLKWKNAKLFSLKIIHRKTPVMMSFEEQFYLWGLRVLFKRGSTTDSFLKDLWSFADLHNYLSRNSKNATCKRSTLLALEMFKWNQKKNQVGSNIIRMRLTQQTKWYSVEAVAQRCSVKIIPWNIW